LHISFRSAAGGRIACPASKINARLCLAPAGAVTQPSSFAAHIGRFQAAINHS
jgi:hypothetical protein